MMRKNGKRILLIFVCVVAVGAAAFLAAWRLWPHPLHEILPVEQDTVSSLSAAATSAGVADGTPSMESRSLTASKEDAAFGDILAFLQDSAYQQDFSNLLPWAGSDVDSSDSSLVTVSLSGPDEAGGCSLTFLGDRVMVLSGSGEMRLYHLQNPEIKEQLIRYLAEKGTEDGPDDAGE